MALMGRGRTPCLVEESLSFHFLVLLFARWCDFSGSVGLVLLVSKKMKLLKEPQTFVPGLSDKVLCEKKASMCSLTN